MVKPTKYSLKGKPRSSYMELVLEFPLASIKSARHLTAAQSVMDRLLAKPKLDAGEQTYLEALSDLAEAYEDSHASIDPPSDADMLRHLLDSRRSPRFN